MRYRLILRGRYVCWLSVLQHHVDLYLSPKMEAVSSSNWFIAQKTIINTFNTRQFIDTS
jgi:hypothetical protein